MIRPTKLGKKKDDMSFDDVSINKFIVAKQWVKWSSIGSYLNELTKFSIYLN